MNVYIALGSNLGNKLFNLRNAVQHLKEKVFSELEESIIIETPALLQPCSPEEWDKPYYNMMVRGSTNLSAFDLLNTLKQIEHRMGRPSSYQKWAPRIIDLDIVLYDSEIIHTSDLIIPHPELLNRPFWLHLMAMLDPQIPLPGHSNSADLANQMIQSYSFFNKSFVLNPQLVGVVNITPDSFSDGGLYYNKTSACEQILNLNQSGASIIEIGAQSTRPGAHIISEEEEYQRLLPILESIESYLHDQKIFLSLDSYSPFTILKLLKQFPIAWINDVKGNLSMDVLSEIARHSCHFVAMHSLGIPPSRENILLNMNEIDQWAFQTIKKLKTCGFPESHIILDPGIGFGKSVYQNLELIKKIKELKKFNCPVLVGHSRKSYIQAFSPEQVIPCERDLETIAISDHLYQAGVDYIRVHNVSAHQRYWVAKKAIN